MTVSLEDLQRGKPLTAADLHKYKVAWAENQGTLHKISDQRAQFAAMMLQGILVNRRTYDDNGRTMSPKAWVEEAVMYADMLVEELKK